MLLEELLYSAGMTLTQGRLDREISGIHYSSRQVEPGGLFVAVPGFRVDGHAYISDAILHGAVAVVVSMPVEVPDDVSVIMTDDSRLALARLSNVFYGEPSRNLRMVGVTGTNGKTTVTFLLKAIMASAELKTGLMGTVRLEIADRVIAASHTTPESRELQETLRTMREAGVTHVIMEVSSHSLALSRVACVEYDTAVFTNLTQDHLDFHVDMEDYFNAKKALFLSLNNYATKLGKTAVINADDRYGSSLMELRPEGVRLLSYGLNEARDLYVSNLRSDIRGSSFLMHTPAGAIDVSINTPGSHSVYNALAAAGAALAEGISLEHIKQGLNCAGVPGRMEPVDMGQNFGLFVDYAHSPDSLDNVLRAARGFTEGKLIVVFGCGGDRDRTKRPIMGNIAVRLADVAILTSDNPRSEDPASIIEDVMAGIEKFEDGARVTVQPDRQKAIKLAVSLAEAGDVVLLTGKGHETYQILASGKIDFDDREEARLALKEVLR